MKSAVELAFHAGELASAGRNPSFERRYDLAGRLVEAREVSVDEANEGLTAIALRRLGLGTAASIADFYRLRTARVREVLLTLESRGEAERVTVGGMTAWKDPAASIPRRVDAVTLLSPFDPLIFHRPRAEALFGLRYRIGIYTPAAERTRGYYSLPLLIGDRIPARYDLKADRRAGILLVNGAFLEPAEDAPQEDEVASHAAAELHRMAAWLGLGDVVVPEGAPGDAVAATARALRSGSS